MKTTTLALTLIIIALSLVIPPVALANLVSLSAGVFLVSSLSTNISHHRMSSLDSIPVLTQVISLETEPYTIHQLGKGYVVVKNINGKLVTRFVRQANHTVSV